MLRQLIPLGATEPFDPFDEAGRARLVELYTPPRRDWVRVNFISSVTGSAAGTDGTSETLTSRIDRRILGVIRAHADLVLVGAQSVRAEGYRIPRTAALAIVTGSGRLDGHRIDTDADLSRIFVLCPAAARDEAARSLPGAQLITVPDDGGRMRVAAILDALRTRGHRSIVCEGGPSLAAQLASADLIDEVCLSTSPLVTAATLPLLGDRPFEPLAVELDGLLLDEGSTLYARWVRASQSRMTDS